jgi:hypothetical protein
MNHRAHQKPHVGNEFELHSQILRQLMKSRISLLMALVFLTGMYYALAQSLASAVNCGVGDGPSCVVATDVNNDGKLDLIIANQGSFSTSVPPDACHFGLSLIWIFV